MPITGPNDATEGPMLVWDPAAYRRLAASAGDDPARARERARHVAAADVTGGQLPVASPMTLWALLADVGSDKGAGDDRARAALAACVAHASATPDRTAAGALRLAPDPENALVRALGATEPKDRAAWPAYLASLAVEVAGAGGQRVAKGPLAHVRERAAQLLADAEDEIQDAVAAAYEAGASEWEASTGVGARQAQVAAATDALTRAVAEGRVARAAAVAGTSATSAADPAALVAERFPVGIAVWREVVRLVVQGRVVPGARGWRGALWGLQVIFTAGTGGVDAVHTGSRIVQQAAERAGAGDVVTDA